MKITSKVTLNLKGFEELRRGLNRGEYVKVGVLGSYKASRKGDTITNPELAVIHEFGAASANIPPRSFIRMPIQSHRKEILNYAASADVRGLLLKGEKKKALGKLGVFAENIIQKAFDTAGFGQWAPNSPRTIAAKGSSHPLVDTGALRRSVTSKVVGV
jgi:phage gpG-like protein